ALREACIALRAGVCETALVVGVDKLSTISGALPRHPDDFEGAQGLTPPALYAARARRYMHDFGVSSSDLALVTVKNRRHAVANEHAQFRDPVTQEQVVSSRMVADPLTLLQCCARADGAAAVIVSTLAPKRAGNSTRILASELCSGRFMPGYR